MPSLAGGALLPLLTDQYTAAGRKAPRMQLCAGMQSVAKFREGEQARNLVRVLVAVLRFPTAGTDIVVSFNDPQVLSTHSSSARAVDPVAVANKGGT
jgi:Ran-interacting Mog1 protein